jgi:uncharacterized protein YprB with RNaseH-like and TPR domain
MLILKKQNIEDLIFFDIETSYADPNFNKESAMWDAWIYDFMKQFQGKDPNMTEEELEVAATEEYFRRAALFPEFGIITCISVGVVRDEELFLMTFSGEEKQMLEDFNDALQRTVTTKSWLVGHAITVFDCPYIAKKCMMHGVGLHKLFDVAHLKPWEVSYLDTAVLWKGTGYKTSSFITMCLSLGVKSSKGDISGADAPRLFWEGEITRICAYCEKDVVATAQCVKVIRGEEPLKISEGTLTVEIDILTYLMSGGKYTEEIEQKLVDFLATLSKTQRAKAIKILQTIPTKKKGMETDILASDIKKLTHL